MQQTRSVLEFFNRRPQTMSTHMIATSVECSEFTELHQKVSRWLREHPPTSAESCYNSLVELMNIRGNDHLHRALISSTSSLDFSGAYLSKYDWIVLAFALPLRREPVCSIVFGAQQIDSHLLMCLTSEFRHLQGLRELNLSKNPIGSLGVQSLLRLARSNSSLVTVVLDEVEVVSSLFRKLERYLLQNSLRTV